MQHVYLLPAQLCEMIVRRLDVMVLNAPLDLLDLKLSCFLTEPNPEFTLKVKATDSNLLCRDAAHVS